MSSVAIPQPHNEARQAWSSVCVYMWDREKTGLTVSCLCLPCLLPISPSRCLCTWRNLISRAVMRSCPALVVCSPLHSVGMQHLMVLYLMHWEDGLIMVDEGAEAWEQQNDRHLIPTEPHSDKPWHHSQWMQGNGAHHPPACLHVRFRSDCETGPVRASSVPLWIWSLLASS